MKGKIFIMGGQTLLSELTMKQLLFQRCTEVKSAPLKNCQKLFLYKVFYRLKLFRKFKFYTWMTISGKKSVNKGQKMTKKATNLVYNAFSIFFLSWLIWNILMVIIWWKKNWCHYITLGLIFSHLVKLTHHFRIY